MSTKTHKYKTRYVCRVIVEEISVSTEGNQITFYEGEVYGHEFEAVDTEEDANRMADRVYNQFVKVTEEAVNELEMEDNDDE